MKFHMTGCNHTLPNGEPALIDMTYNREFMRQFTKPLAASAGKERPELANFHNITPQKARKLMQGAHLFVCKLCGFYFIGDKTNVYGKQKE